MSDGFTTFITESRKVLSEDSWLKHMRQHCANSHTAAKTSGLFTTIKSDNDFLLVEPKNLDRKTMFMVDDLIEKLASWKHTPHRRKALIGYTSLSSARQYAGKEEKLYIMLPYDRGSLCMVNAESFYSGCEKACKALHITSISNGQLRSWVSSLRRVAKAIGITTAKNEPMTANEFLVAVNELEGLKDAKKIEDLQKLDDDDLERAVAFASRSGTPEEFLSNMFDPDVNRVEKFLAIHHNMPADREIWTETPCLLISLSAYKRLYEAGKIK